MSERNPIEQNPAGRESRRLHCEDLEGLMADAVDESLSAADAAAFRAHVEACAACAELFEQARRGIAWLGYLEAEPQTPADLMRKILARTSGAALTPAMPVGRAAQSSARMQIRVPAWYRSAAPVARRIVEPRLLMTAAMAFFSIALTLNLTGIRLSGIRLADLRPSAMRITLARQYYSAKEEGVKYYDNLRFVYEMEARVRELKRSTEAVPTPASEAAPSRRSPSSQNGAPGRKTPDGEAGRSGTPQRSSHPDSAEESGVKQEVLVSQGTRGRENRGALLLPEKDSQAGRNGLIPRAWKPSPGVRRQRTAAQAGRSLA
ncbi:MAG TPA: zf-HC2 domain-containing protein [Acidobacteriaceae bacterium]|nr:zf-HC2 domain-containing protein [Acidobacteriaceae bacterium]